MFVLALPAWGACRSANVDHQLIDTNIVTSWFDPADMRDMTFGWSQNNANAESFAAFYFLGGSAGSEAEADNYIVIIHNPSGKQAGHEQGAGTDENTSSDDFCTANACSAGIPNYYTMVGERISATKTYNIDWVNRDNIATVGSVEWNETFSQTYTNEHTGGTNGLQFRAAHPRDANQANLWFYRGLLPEALQRATAYGFYPWDSSRFYLTPCRDGVTPDPENWGSIPFVWSPNAVGAMVATNSPPPATVLPMWMLQ